jgi:hypothetical protein
MSSLTRDLVRRETKVLVPTRGTASVQGQTRGTSRIPLVFAMGCDGSRLASLLALHDRATTLGG